VATFPTSPDEVPALAYRHFASALASEPRARGEQVTVLLLLKAINQQALTQCTAAAA
jgi:hypothetical protein